jgi:hypothetical protein
MSLLRLPIASRDKRTGQKEMKSRKNGTVNSTNTNLLIGNLF